MVAVAFARIPGMGAADLASKAWWDRWASERVAGGPHGCRYLYGRGTLPSYSATSAAAGVWARGASSENGERSSCTAGRDRTRRGMCSWGWSVGGWADCCFTLDHLLFHLVEPAVHGLLQPLQRRHYL